MSAALSAVAGRTHGATTERPVTARPALRNVSNGIGTLIATAAQTTEKGDTPSNLLPPTSSNMRITRLAAARQRQADLQHGQLKKGRHQSPAVAFEDPMAVETAGGMAETPPVDAQQCSYILSDIYQYLRCRELRHRAGQNFLQAQQDINSNMRSILIDWLVEVGEEYKLQAETLHLCVNYIDRFLAHVPVSRSKLQLVGVGCMLVASKYEDVSPPTVEDLVYISDNTYTREDILKMEGMILQRLQFNLSVVTSVAFLPNFTRVAMSSCGCDGMVVPLAYYLVELSLLSYGFVKWRPSEVSASAVRLALHTLRLPAWTPQLEQATGYCAADLTACVSDLYIIFAGAETSQLQAIREKYAHRSFLHVANLKPQPLLPG